VQVTAGVEAKRFVVRLEDEGGAFDIEAAAAPDLSGDLAARGIGGLGIHLMRSLMDEVCYRREANRNILELVVDLPPGKAKP
jgi:anti-sigma regulatory factor (Ser/Thr protein kinase)